MVRLSIPMSGVENGSECSKLHQDSREEEHQKAGYPRIRYFCFAVLQTSRFDCGFHDRTSDLSACKLRADAAVDVQVKRVGIPDGKSIGFIKMK
jgi:hypothetical protein